METPRNFKTKTGYCTVTEDKIFLTRDGVIGEISNVAVGNRMTRILVIYGILVAGLIYVAIDSYVKGAPALAFILGLLACYLLYAIFKSRNNSATPVITRKDIQKVTYKPAVNGLTRGRFEVLFTENGRQKTRLILLPGSMADGESEAAIALQIFCEAQLLEGEICDGMKGN
jgi:hypothetical protein